MKSLLRSFGTGVLIGVIFLSIFPPHPPRAHALFGAGDVVSDFIAENEGTISAGYNLVSSAAEKVLANKEMVLDPIAWAVAKSAIASMTKSMVNWINSGFNGSPAFVTNLQVYLGNMNFTTANTFITQLSTNPAISSPFQSQVASLLNLNFLKSSASNGFFLQNPYTLNQVSTNATGFVNGSVDFTTGGGWNAWFALTTQPQNNIYGAYNLAQSELSNRLATTQSNALTQLGWGQGFLSWCGNATGGGGGANAGGQCKTGDDCAGALTCLPNGTCGVDSSLGNPAGSCTNKDGSTGTIQTPGSIIQGQLNKTLGLTGDTLVTADEFNEVIGALMGQLVNQVVGGVGLSGVSSVSSGGTGYIDQAVTQQATSVSSAGTTVTSAITAQLQQVTQYQSAWQTIGNEAAAANTALSGSCLHQTPGGAAAVATTTAQAAAAASRATSGIAALDSVRNEITAAGSDATAIATASNDYETLTAGTAVPSATDVANADAQTQDVTASVSSTTPIASLPLYSQMKFVVGMCQGTIS